MSSETDIDANAAHTVTQFGAMSAADKNGRNEIEPAALCGSLKAWI
jgi:hypothetical protein